jgi:uncharacterized membrane-anchored protein
MKLIPSICAFLITAALSCTVAAAPPSAPPSSDDDALEQVRSLPWQRGPAKGSLGDKASVQIPANGALLPQGQSDKFLELTGNLPSPKSSVITHGNWWAIFGFVDEGYVKDDEKVDPDALLQVLQETQKEANEEREKRGLPLMYIDGWYVPPRYDKAANRLEWGTKLHSSTSSEPFVNYTVRILGRSGHESATLVSDPENLDKDVKEFKEVLASFEFNPGEKYSEFKQGDRIAAYGLGALVIGGAAAVAAKSGFWKVIVAALAAGWKFIAAGAVVLLAGLRKFLGGGRKA